MAIVPGLPPNSQSIPNSFAAISINPLANRPRADAYGFDHGMRCRESHHGKRGGKLLVNVSTGQVVDSVYGAFY